MLEESLDLPPGFLVLVAEKDPVERDDDYLRELLLELEAASDWLHPIGLTMGMSAEARKKYFHACLLADEGFLEANGRDGDIFRITNAGHDFIALTRKSEAWQAARSAARHLGGASIRMLFSIAEGYARGKLRDLGVSLD